MALQWFHVAPHWRFHSSRKGTAVQKPHTVKNPSKLKACCLEWQTKQLEMRAKYSHFYIFTHKQRLFPASCWCVAQHSNDGSCYKNAFPTPSRLKQTFQFQTTASCRTLLLVIGPRERQQATHQLAAAPLASPL